jgi:SAM-dependent methyltransferase
MQYEPIKKTLGRFFSGSPFFRKLLYSLLDLLLLRTWHVKKRLRLIAGNYPGEASILDAGSGFGQYSWYLSKMNKKWSVNGVDINEDQISECIRFFADAGLSDRVTFNTADITRLAHEERYDIILSVDVMEHIEEDVIVFKNFYRSIKAGGFLLISTPSDNGGSDVHNGSEKSFIEEHVRDGYSIKDITAKLASAGFNNIEARYTYGIPGNISWRLSVKYPIKMLNASYSFFILLPFYYIVFFPISLILNIFDLILIHKTGTGLLVTARK